MLPCPMYIVYNHQQISSAFYPLNWGLDLAYCIIQVKSVLDISVVFKMTVLLTHLIYCIGTATWIVKTRDNFKDVFARPCETGTLVDIIKIQLTRWLSLIWSIRCKSLPACTVALILRAIFDTIYSTGNDCLDELWDLVCSSIRATSLTCVSIDKSAMKIVPKACLKHSV